MTPADHITAFLLERIAERALADQILLYRCLAAETEHATLKESCRALASELEAAQRRQQKITADFHRGTLS